VSLPNLLILAIAVVALAQTLLGFVLELAAQQAAGIVRDTTQPLFQCFLLLIPFRSVLFRLRFLSVFVVRLLLRLFRLVF